MRPLRRTALLLLLLGLTAMLVAAEEPPGFVIRGGALVLASLPDLAQRKEVADFLASGLTTSFVLEVTVRDRERRRVTGGCLLELRYDLWDEAYLAIQHGFDGRRARSRLASQRELGGLFAKLDLKVADVRALAVDGAWSLRVRLAVLPFSSAEQSDAQRWFGRTLGSESPGGDEPADREREERGGGALLNLLLATSIGREEAASFDWQVELSPEARR